MRLVKRGLAVIVTAAIVVFCLFPAAWMLSTSLKQTDETFRTPPRWIPASPTLANYVEMWRIQPYARYFLNSAIVASITTILSVMLSALAGYGFSRFRFKGSSGLLVFVLVTQMFPGILLIIPYFMMAGRLGLFNKYPALFIAYVSFALPFCIWMLKGFFDSVPVELDEAAMVDGCSRLGALVRVVLPVSLPGILATSVFSFLLAWNEFLFALCLTSTPDMYVVTVGIASNIGQYRILWNHLMAAGVLATLPTVVLYAIFERYLVQGLTAGAVKG